MKVMHRFQSLLILQRPIPVLLGIGIRRFLTPSNLVMEGILSLVSMSAIAWIIGTIVG